MGSIFSSLQTSNQIIQKMIGGSVWILFFFSSSSFILHLGSPIPDTCPNATCQPGGPVVHFPFRLRQLQPNERCVYPGFDLLCDGLGRTIINLPPSGEFIVASILYSEQFMLLRDPENCLSKRLRSLSLLDPRWNVQAYKNFTFIKCPLDLPIFPGFTPIPCLSDRNHTVVAIPTEDCERAMSTAMSGCVHNWTVLAPSKDDALGSIGLTWSEPTCGECHAHGMVCGFKLDTGLETTCSGESEPEEDRPKSTAAKLEALIGIGLPWLMIILCIFCCISRKIWLQGQAQQNQTDPASSARQVEVVSVTRGMDTPTIESCPKAQIGDGGLPLPGDGTCSICLLDYKPEETVRMIPECNHYFHAQCIDPWLRRNASCPLCRNHQG
ncbi:hypothetical protein BT93_D1949 [Corymbia citriodora subsp. variegata]|nr:hypothetical protein BT93_D1949 [Corymbia citriodora subsp. variegata]